MSTTMASLAAQAADLTSKVGALATAVSAVDADVKKLLANSTAGPGPGQVIVNQTDLDAVSASLNAVALSVSASTGTLAADDTSVNPPVK